MPDAGRNRSCNSSIIQTLRKDFVRFVPLVVFIKSICLAGLVPLHLWYLSIFYIIISAFPRIIPVDPPIVNINKKRSPKNAELILRYNNDEFPRYVLNQLKIFVPVGKDIKIVTPVK